MYLAIIKPILWTLAATALYAGLALTIFSLDSKNSPASAVDNITTSSITK